jgi:hypothetical protein
MRCTRSHRERSTPAAPNCGMAMRSANPVARGGTTRAIARCDHRPCPIALSLARQCPSRTNAERSDNGKSTQSDNATSRRGDVRPDDRAAGANRPGGDGEPTGGFQGEGRCAVGDAGQTTARDYRPTATPLCTMRASLAPRPQRAARRAGSAGSSSCRAARWPRRFVLASPVPGRDGDAPGRAEHHRPAGCCRIMGPRSMLSCQRDRMHRESTSSRSGCVPDDRPHGEPRPPRHPRFHPCASVVAPARYPASSTPPRCGCWPPNGNTPCTRTARHPIRPPAQARDTDERQDPCTRTAPRPVRPPTPPTRRMCDMDSRQHPMHQNSPTPGQAPDTTHATDVRYGLAAIPHAPEQPHARPGPRHHGRATRTRRQHPMHQFTHPPPRGRPSRPEADCSDLPPQPHAPIHPARSAGQQPSGETPHAQRTIARLAMPTVSPTVP